MARVAHGSKDVRLSRTTYFSKVGYVADVQLFHKVAVVCLNNVVTY